MMAQPVVPALGKPRQEDGEFQASLGNIKRLPQKYNNISNMPSGLIINILILVLK
jgi:hypothetical protein